MEYETIKECKYKTKDYQAFAVYITRLLQESQIPKEQVYRVILASCSFQSGQFLGPFSNESIEGIAHYFNGRAQVQVFNDVEGQGQSLIYQETLLQQHKDFLIQLKHNKTKEVKPQQKVKLLFTMGTGIGLSLILPYPVAQPDGSNEYKHFVRPSESWTSLSSADESNARQSDLGKYLFRKLKKKSSILAFCKGPAILSLHQFMQERNPHLKTNIDQVVKKALKKQAKIDYKKSKIKEKAIVTKQECITYAAVNGLDDLCMQTIDFLIEILGQCLGKLALTFLPMGGIYIGGGVGNYLAEYIEKKQDIFWQYFLNHPLMRESLLENIPIFVMKENPTLDGLQAMQLSIEKRLYKTQQ